MEGPWLTPTLAAASVAPKACAVDCEGGNCSRAQLRLLRLGAWIYERPRGGGGAWPASFPQVGNKYCQRKRLLYWGAFLCPLGINVREGTTAQCLPNLIFLSPPRPGWFLVPTWQQFTIRSAALVRYWRQV